MMIPGIMAQRRVVAGGGTLWTPLNMMTVPQIYLDAQDSVVTNVSGLASAISNLGAMGSDGDFSQTDAARRPAILAAALNGNKVLSFDGTSDWLFCNTAVIRDIFRAKSAAWSFSVYKKRGADASPTSRVIANFLSDTGATRFAHWCGSATAGKANTPFLSYNAGTFTTVQGSTASSGAYALSSVVVDLVAGSTELYLNGQLDASAAASTGTFPDTSASASFSAAVIGSRADAAWMPDMDLAAQIVGNTPLTSAERQKLEGWAAHKYGLTANLPGGHPYKTVAPTT